MNRARRSRKIKMLWAMVLLAIAYGSLAYYHRMLVGVNRLDGSIGVLLGLYICSHPAANMLDLLFFSSSVGYQFTTRRSMLFWLGLNALVFVVGWVVIFVGTTQFAGRAA